MPLSFAIRITSTFFSWLRIHFSAPVSSRPTLLIAESVMVRPEAPWTPTLPTPGNPSSRFNWVAATLLMSSDLAADVFSKCSCFVVGSRSFSFCARRSLRFWVRFSSSSSWRITSSVSLGSNEAIFSLRTVSSSSSLLISSLRTLIRLLVSSLDSLADTLMLASDFSAVTRSPSTTASSLVAPPLIAFLAAL